MKPQRVGGPKSHDHQQSIDDLEELEIEFLFSTRAIGIGCAKHRKTLCPPLINERSNTRIRDTPLRGKAPVVVGTIHSPGALRRALKLRRGEVDFLELRIDHFADDPLPLLEAARQLPARAIAGHCPPSRRGRGAPWPGARPAARALAQFLPLAALHGCGTALVCAALGRRPSLRPKSRSGRPRGQCPRALFPVHAVREPANVRRAIRQRIAAGAGICKAGRPMASTASGPGPTSLLAVFAQRESAARCR